MVFIMDVLIHDDMGTCTSIYKQAKIAYFFHACVFLVRLGQGVGSGVGGGSVMTVTLVPYLAWYLSWMS